MAYFQHVLIVDDDPVALYVNQHRVETHRLGNTIQTCTTAAQALAYVKQISSDSPDSGQQALPDLLLLDIHMPEMDGLEFLEAFYALSEERWKKTFLFVLTTSTHTTDWQHASAFPIDGYLNKPFGEKQIRQILSLVE